MLCVCMDVHLKIQWKHPQTLPLSFLHWVCRPDVCEITPRYERIRSCLETRCIQTWSAVKWIRSAEISTVEFGVKWERLCCVTTGSRWNCGIVQVHICKITAKHHVKFHRKLCLRWLDKGAIVSVPTETRTYIHLSRYEWKTTHLRCVRAAQPSSSVCMFSWRNTGID